jgi:hypothetical protein
VSGVVVREQIERSILVLRGHKVLLDTDLAALYAVQPRTLIQAVKRNIERFPDDFMFQLRKEESQLLRSQTVILKNRGRGRHRKYLPYAFTEQGVAMLSSVLRSRRAVLVNVEIMRTFAKLRQLVSSHKEFAAKLEQLERKVGGHDGHIRSLFEAIRQLMEPPTTKVRRIGFKA